MTIATCLNAAFAVMTASIPTLSASLIGATVAPILLCAAARCSWFG
jgi:hypothetical protein